MDSGQKSNRITAGQLKKIAKKMELAAPKHGEEDRPLTVSAAVDGLIKPIQIMLERGYTVPEISAYLKEQGAPVSAAAIRAGLSRAGVSLRKKRRGAELPETEAHAWQDRGEENDRGEADQMATNQGYGNGDTYR